MGPSSHRNVSPPWSPMREASRMRREVLRVGASNGEAVCIKATGLAAPVATHPPSL